MTPPVRVRILRLALSRTVIDSPLVARLLHAKLSTCANWLSRLASDGLLYPDGQVGATGKKLYKISMKGRQWLEQERADRRPDDTPLAQAMGYGK